MGAQALKLLPIDEREFGRYRLLCRFAKGGMANLYLAQLVGDSGFEKLVAIKRIHEHLNYNREFCNMFVDEARLHARLSHPNVVQVIELGSVANSLFIAMEYVEGESLRALVRRIKLPLPLCARIVSDAAAGLHHAHQLRDSEGNLLNVVHRDVSPQNILISYEGMVKMVDFGVARARGNLHQTSVGQIKGKFAYMAPEQVDGEVDHRTDVYALGIVLYEITTNHRLFKGARDAATISRVRRREIPRPSLLRSGYPTALENIVTKALEPDPEQRFQTAEELEDELEGFLLKSGEFVTPRHLRQVMQRVFADRIAMKQELLARCEEASGILHAPVGMSSGPSLALKGAYSQADLRIADRRRLMRRILVATGSAALTLLIAALLLYLLR
jgi:serine/threonine-protein kinase